MKAPEFGTLLFVTGLIADIFGANRRQGAYVKFLSATDGRWNCLHRDGSIAAYWPQELDSNVEMAARNYVARMRQRPRAGNMWPAEVESAMS